VVPPRPPLALRSGLFRVEGTFEGGGERVSGYVLTADEGDAYDWRGARVVIKAASDDTSGQLGVMESTYPPGLSVPTHFHAGEDEMLYVLAGELHGYCDGERWTVTPGSFVFVPRDRPHGFTVIGDEPARALVIVGPARLDVQVAATGVAVPGRPRRRRP
jgi:quercetin dioxygenase-like cupin family protein